MTQAVAIGASARYTARVSDDSTAIGYWRPVRLRATGEWCVAAPGAPYFVRLSDASFPEAAALTSAQAEHHACKLADALNRVYGYAHAPRFLPYDDATR